ncbi:Ig-like domain-containing protein [Cohnella faecalis]|uniref:BIG2 domain-containing protein n=1 Tax=Cohnella faecalis TaxID=2315694 RepID=A0A398CK24_9BACL|nr:Ig-like domain-containing protein [Cohnella faecalis]RIE02695.1 hypothetical protein D3H35_18745 [Cohnella faecalis]
MAKESEKQLTVTANYTDGTTKDVTLLAAYESSDSAVASVSEEGLVKGLTAGQTAAITATFEGRKVSATVTVTAELPVLTLDSYDFTLAKGSTKQLAVTASYADGSTKEVTAFATYLSSDPAVASVSAAGLVKGLTAGQTTVVTATYEKQKVSSTVRVASPPETPVISLNAYDFIVVQGNTRQLVVTANYSDGRTEDVTSLSVFQSSAPESVSVSAAGLVTGLSSGQQATITVTYRGQSLSASVRVVSSPEAPVIVLNSYDFTLVAGSVKQLLVTASDGDGGTEDVTALTAFRSSDPAVATASAEGLVTAITAGQAVVTATYLGQSVSATVHVTNKTVTSPGSGGAGMPPLIWTFDPPDWMTGLSPSSSWNTAVGREEASGEAIYRLNGESAMRLAKTASANTKVWTIGVKQSGSSVLVVPFPAAKAAFDISGGSGTILFATEAGSFSLPLSVLVLKANGALEGNEGEIRIEISPSEGPGAA